MTKNTDDVIAMLLSVQGDDERVATNRVELLRDRRYELVETAREHGRPWAWIAQHLEMPTDTVRITHLRQGGR